MERSIRTFWSILAPLLSVLLLPSLSPHNLFTLAYPAPPSDPQDLITTSSSNNIPTKNITSSSSSSSTALLNSTIHCSSDSQFFTPIFRPSDCTAAIKRFIDAEVWPSGRLEYEFLPPDPTVTGTTPNPKKRTPLKWTVGSCTVVVLTLSALAPNEIREITPSPRGSWTTDVTNFEALSHGIETAAFRCLAKFADGGVGEGIKANGTLTPEEIVFGDGEWGQGSAVQTSKAKRGSGEELEGSGGGLGFRDDTGFAVMGRNHAVGIFMWAPGSDIDLRHP